MTVSPFVFIRKDEKKKFTKTIERHETTHALQQLETLWIFFYIIYGAEYLVKLLCTFSHDRAYKSVSFEQEAYVMQKDKYYNKIRSHYAWWRYVFKLT